MTERKSPYDALGWESRLEQAEAGIEQFAQLCATLFGALLSRGFTRPEALEVVQTWIQNVTPTQK